MHGLNLRVHGLDVRHSEMTDRDWSVQGESREDLNVHRWELWCSEVWVREQRGAMSIEKGMEAN